VRSRGTARPAPAIRAASSSSAGVAASAAAVRMSAVGEVWRVVTKTRPAMEKALTSGASAPVTARERVSMSPALGPARITQAVAPRNEGVTRTGRR